MTDAAAVGLCFTCRWMRAVTNRRGSTFFQCGRAERDARFVRYPPLPVLTCPGYDDARPPSSGSTCGPAVRPRGPGA